MDVPTPRSAPRASAALRVVGVVLLLAWGVAAVKSLGRDRLYHGELAWFPALDRLFGDFTVSVDHAARVLAAGGDPYGADWICRRFPYPPLVTRLFLWVAPLDTGTAAVVWAVAHVLILAGAAGAAWATRRKLGLIEVPLSLALAAGLCSGPVVFALERGQCDALALPFLGAGAWLLGRRSKRAEVLAGAVFALAAWVKFYPGIVLLGLVACRRWRAVTAFAVVGLAVGLADPVGVAHALHNARHAGPPRELTRPAEMAWCSHSLSAYWRPLWAGTRFAALGKLPGLVAATALLLPFLAYVSRRVGRASDPGALAYPLALWLMAAGTFLPTGATDYNLIFLPLSALAVWDGRDRPAVHMLMALALLVLQPFAFVLDPRLIFLFKLGGIVATGLCLLRRSDEASVAPQTAARRVPHLTRISPAVAGRSAVP